METVSTYRIFLYKILPSFISNIFNRLTVKQLHTLWNCFSWFSTKLHCGNARLCVSVRDCPRPHAHTIARTRM